MPKPVNGKYSLVGLLPAAGIPVGKIYARVLLKSGSDFPLAEAKVSTSKGTLLRRVENEMKWILLFDIC